MDLEAKEKALVRLHKDYIENKARIRARLAELGRNLEKCDQEIFAELAFCLCTPQTKAKNAWFKAVCPLAESGRLYRIGKEDLASALRDGGVRFHNTKAERIVEAREKWMPSLGEYLRDSRNTAELRCCLAKNIKGLGLKEASHFLRNLGLGKDLAILDRHILKNLVLLGVIPREPKNISWNQYLEIEDAMREFSRREKIPMDELDMLLWMRETGEIFK